VYDASQRRKVLFTARAVILATGGAGQLYKYTTNPPVATADGMAAAFRAGCPLTDMEFIQFHPTVLFTPETQRFLISEAVRGEGGRLYNVRGEAFMANYHPLKELAPRDVVSRAIVSETRRTGSEYVWLDMTQIPRVKDRFPTIYQNCLQRGIDLTREWVPVFPAAHYTMGGIATNTYGETALPGLYACGEAACTGVHGANRLASNSLLEGIVFGQRIVSKAEEIMYRRRVDPMDIYRHFDKSQVLKTQSGRISPEQARLKLQETMWENVGILRDEPI